MKMYSIEKCEKDYYKKSESDSKYVNQTIFKDSFKQFDLIINDYIDPTLNVKTTIPIYNLGITFLKTCV